MVQFYLWPNGTCVQGIVQATLAKVTLLVAVRIIHILLEMLGQVDIEHLQGQSHLFEGVP